MGKLKITFISDTHSKHHQITKHLTGGDILIHAGDMSSMGYKHEIEDFCKWFDGLDNYDTKVFIAGNHDWGFQDNVEQTMQIINSYKSFDYLQDGLFMMTWLKFTVVLGNLSFIIGRLIYLEWGTNLRRNGI